MVLLVALALLLGLFLALLLIPPHHKSGQKGNAHSNLNNNDKGSKSYRKAEVSLHHKRTDCWIIIKNKVYDVTSYVEEHPGGDAILAHAGDDSTEGFFGVPVQSLYNYMAPKADKKRKKDVESCFGHGNRIMPQHATRVFDMIDDFYIGDLEQ